MVAPLVQTSSCSCLVSWDGHVHWQMLISGQCQAPSWHLCMCMLASCDSIEADHDSQGCCRAGAQPGCTLWQRISVMQVVRQLCTDAHFINFLCTIYDVAQVSVCCSGLAVPILLWTENCVLCTIYEFAQVNVCRSCLVVLTLVLTKVPSCFALHQWCS